MRGNAKVIKIEVGSARLENGCVAEYVFHAVRMANEGSSLKEARDRLRCMGLPAQIDPQNRYLPSQLDMALQGASAEARYQLCQEYAVQLQDDVQHLAANPVTGSHYTVLLDVSSSMMDTYLRAHASEVDEFREFGFDAKKLQEGANITILEHILDTYFVPCLLQKGINVGNAKFSGHLIRNDAPSSTPTPFVADSHLNGGGTEIYRSLMTVAASLTLPFLDMNADAGVILITDGEQYSSGIDMNLLGRLFSRNFRLHVICIRSNFAGPLQKLVRRSFSTPYQIGNLRNLLTALKETAQRIEQRTAMSPENLADIRQPVELFHPNMWYLLQE
jgi:hypothetical protein